MKILITDEVAEEAMDLLKEKHEVKFQELRGEELANEIGKYDALMVRSGTKVTADIIERADNLKVIGRAGIGVDNIDVEAASRKGIYVVNSPGGSTRSVAELTIGHMLCLARHIPYADRSIREGKWEKKKLKGIELQGKKLGIIGFGRIGQAIARRAKGFNMRILYYSRTRKPEKERELGAEFKPLDELLRESDFVVLAVPLTNETYHMINEERLKLMKPTAILVNIARGKVVDTKALVKALKEGWIAGAGLDVFEEEPYYNEELFKLKNVTLAPHIGSATYGARYAMAELVARNLIAFAKGEVPPTLVNREVLNVRKPGFSR